MQEGLRVWLKAATLALHEELEKMIFIHARIQLSVLGAVRVYPIAGTKHAIFIYFLGEFGWVHHDTRTKMVYICHYTQTPSPPLESVYWRSHISSVVHPWAMERWCTLSATTGIEQSGFMTLDQLAVLRERVK